MALHRKSTEVALSLDHIRRDNQGEDAVTDVPGPTFEGI
jgi:hypothetical protein